MIEDDGDIVRGLGFVSMYSAWLEEDVDDILRFLNPVVLFEEKNQRWSISRKLDHAITILRRLNSHELVKLQEALEKAKELFDKRNEVIHGRIYAGFDKIDYVQSGRINRLTREITSKELYQLAKEFWHFRGFFIGPQSFKLPQAVQEFLNVAS